MSSKANAADTEVMSIRPLGGGHEVGRSCIILQFKGRNIMLDCGHHPGREGIEGLPYFNYIEDPSEIDLILITHFHIDHCAALPYFTEKCHPPFTGRIFMTHATKAVMRMLLSDQIKLTSRSRPIYSEADLENCLNKIECIDFHTTVEMKGIKFFATAAGHVLGACMYSIEIDGIKVLYTGDYSLEPDRHLLQASVPPGGSPDVMIVESTFGITNLPPRLEREVKFTSTIESIVRKGGSCLIPVFALGRAQELLLILDEYWQANPDLQSVPVFYASKLAHKALRVYQTFVNMMNAHIRTMMDVGNPFKLTHVKSMLRQDFDAMGACVVMASPGFLQNGVSRHLFERWCDDSRNGVIIAGYTVEGTLAHQLLEQPQTITCQDNQIKPRRCQIEHVSFTAHVDYNDNLRFMKEVAPDYIILVHGEKNGMKRLKDELHKEISRNWPAPNKPHVAMPDNNTIVKLRFSKAVTAECVGQLGQEMLDRVMEIEGQEGLGLPMPSEGRRLAIPPKAVLVSENFVSKIVAASELANFTSCRRGRVVQKMVVPVPEGLLGPAVARGGLLRALVPYLDEVFEAVVVDPDGSVSSAPPVPAPISGGTASGGGDLGVSLVIQGVVRVCEDFSSVSATAPAAVLVAWEASPSSDLVADCAVGAILQTLSVPSLLHLSLLGQTLGGIAASSAKAQPRGSKFKDKDKGKGSKGGEDEGDSGEDPIDSEFPLYRGAKRRNTRGHIHVKADPDAQGPSSAVSAAIKVELEQRLDAIVAQMKTGGVDPSRSLPQGCVAFSTGSSHGQPATATTIDNRTRLENLRAQIMAQPAAAQAFATVKLTADGLKLIFVAATAPASTSRPKKPKLEGVAEAPANEAFVYVAFSATGAHQAVVSSDDEGLRAKVSSTLASLS